MPKIVGIDLGTTNCCLSFVEGNTATVVPQPEGGRTLPSIVAILESGEQLVGSPAKRQAITNADRTISGIKRLIGRRFDSPEAERLGRRMGYEVVRGSGGSAAIQVDGRNYTPVEVSAMLLGHIKGVAEDFIGEDVHEAVITVPAHFNELQRQATKDAGELAGLTVRRLVNEPTAAALGYGLHRRTEPQTLAVFDLGGGTFDVTVLRFESGVFEVLATAGDNLLGGDDFDHVLIEHLRERFAQDTGHPLADEAVSRQRLREAAETAKRELSTALTTSVHLPFVSVDEDGPQHLQVDELTRRTLEELSKDLLSRLEGPCRTALSEAGLATSHLDQVLMVGGMTRMPAVQQRAREIFQREPSKGVDPDEVVAIGAASQGAILAGELEEVILLDVTGQSLGLRTRDDEMSVLIARNTSVPASDSKVFRTTRDNQEQVIITAFQGESRDVKHNAYVGELRLGNLPRKPAGGVQVEVTFTINTDGLLEVTARELTSGAESSVEMRV